MTVTRITVQDYGDSNRIWITVTVTVDYGDSNRISGLTGRRQDFPVLQTFDYASLPG